MKGGMPRSVVLLAHGLNLKPGRMRAIEHAVQDAGGVPILFTLPGHEGDWRALRRFDTDRLLRRTSEVLRDAERARSALARTKAPDGDTMPPLRFVGVSFGALAVLCVLTEAAARRSGNGLETARAGATAEAREGPAVFTDAILLSPALSLRRRVRWLEPAARRLSGAVPVPSISAPQNRVFPALPLQAYRVLFETLARFENAVARRPLELPLRIYLDAADELIWPAGIARLIRTGALPTAELVTAAPAPARGAEGGDTERHRGPAHLLVDRDSMGAALWRDLQRALTGGPGQA
jgi:hypothetical protein